MADAQPRTDGLSPRGASAILSAGAAEAQVATLAGSRMTEAVMPSEAAGDRLAWRGGILAFTGQPLPDVVTELSRYTDVHIDASDPRLRNVRVAAYFEAGAVERTLDALSTGLGIRVERIDASHVRLLPGNGFTRVASNTGLHDGGRNNLGAAALTIVRPSVAGA